MSPRIVRVLAAACLILPASLTAAVSADARDARPAPVPPENVAYVARTCPGAIIDEGPLYSSPATRTGAHPTARWYMYFSKAGGGTNCLMVRDNMAGSHAMRAHIATPHLRRGSVAYYNDIDDRGTFADHAGGAAATGTAHTCVTWLAAANIGGTVYASSDAVTHKRFCR